MVSEHNEVGEFLAEFYCRRGDEP